VKEVKMCHNLLRNLQKLLVKGVRFEETVELSFPGVEIEEIVVFTPNNTHSLQVVWYDFYIPLFSVLVDGKGRIVDHQFIQKYDVKLAHKLYIKSNRIYDTVYLLKFITLEDCVKAGFTEKDCV